MKNNSLARKILVVMLTLSMVFSYIPVPTQAYASVIMSGLCGHHTEHTAECGYVEGTEAQPCTHEHSEDCYTRTRCVHEHDADCKDDCAHKCSIDSGCVTMKQNCSHTHGDCAYSEGSAAVPCAHTHDDSCG